MKRSKQITIFLCTFFSLAILLKRLDSTISQDVLAREHSDSYAVVRPFVSSVDSVVITPSSPLAGFTTREIRDIRESMSKRTTFIFRIIEKGSHSSAFVKIGLFKDSERVSFGTFAQWLKESESFRSEFNEVVSSAVPFDAFFFECPPTTKSRVSVQPFEFVLTKSARLSEIRARPFAFPQIAKLEGKVGAVAFENLGRDAILVAPSSYPRDASYSHLARFVRDAPGDQYHVFWKNVAEAFESRVAERKESPTWFSTSGLGVAWLHVRLDSRPKYYVHGPYKKAPGVS